MVFQGWRLQARATSLGQGTASKKLIVTMTFGRDLKKQRHGLLGLGNISNGWNLHDKEIDFLSESNY